MFVDHTWSGLTLDLQESVCSKAVAGQPYSFETAMPHSSQQCQVNDQTHPSQDSSHIKYTYTAQWTFLRRVRFPWGVDLSRITVKPSACLESALRDSLWACLQQLQYGLSWHLSEASFELVRGRTSNSGMNLRLSNCSCSKLRGNMLVCLLYVWKRKVKRSATRLHRRFGPIRSSWHVSNHEKLHVGSAAKDEGVRYGGCQRSELTDEGNQRLVWDNRKLPILYVVYMTCSIPSSF